MKITYDPEADALYIYFREGEVARTREASEGIQLDEDAEGHGIGLEILDFSTRVSPEAARSISVSLPLPG